MSRKIRKTEIHQRRVRRLKRKRAQLKAQRDSRTTRTKTKSPEA